MNDSLNGWAISYDSVFNTTNGGMNWTFNNVGLTGFEDVYFIDLNTGWMVSGTYIVKTTNRGQNWSIQYTGPTQYRVWFVDHNTGFTFAVSQLCRRTTNGGTNWNTITIGAGSVSLLSVNFINHDTGWIGANNGILYKTIDCGLNWVTINTGFTTRLYDIRFPVADTGWAGGFDMFGESKILFTSNGGTNWVSKYDDPISQGVESIFFVTPREGWAAGLPGKIMHTTNAGLNWDLQQSNAGNIHLFSTYFVNSKTGWITGVAGGVNGKILKTTTGGLVPFINISNEVPKDFYLYQNYPNPFNPVTKIKYQIAKNTYVSIIVSDILGKEIAVIGKCNQNAGIYETEWDASKHPSGIYFYTLAAEGIIMDTKKMLLIK